MNRWLALGLLLFTLTACAGWLSPSARAEDDAPPEAAVVVEEAEAETPAEEAAEEAEVFSFEDDVAYSFNTMFMMLTGVLVIFMQAGFAMVEVGLNSQKNAVNILFKNLMDFCIGVLLFISLGYGLMYPGGDYKGKWFGHTGTWGVTRDAQPGETEGSWSEPPSSMTWSNSADFVFQVAFAATAATIVSGAVAGRLKFPAYLIYSAFISALVYPVSGMWKWGGGALAAMGFQDFAGSVVVHAVGGFAGLAGALLLGPRIGRFSADGKSHPMPGHNLTFAALGVFILWVGWYGFNPGSQLTYFGAVNAEITTYVALTTTLAGAAGAVSAMLFAWGLFGKPDLTMALNGALAGLVGITANCNQVSQPESIVIGGIAGLLVVSGIIALEKLKIDDPVGAFPVHGICGVWGGIATGIFGDAFPTVTGADGVEVTLDRMQYILVQVEATAIIVAWAFGTMLLLFGALKAVNLLRVSAEEEIRGLDIGEHGMEAYVTT